MKALVTKAFSFLYKINFFSVIYYSYICIMENTLLNTIIEERATVLPQEQVIRRHTRWIANQSTVPIVTGVFGTYINPHCHVLDTYDQKHLEKMNK